MRTAVVAGAFILGAVSSQFLTRFTLRILSAVKGATASRKSNRNQQLATREGQAAKINSSIPQDCFCGRSSIKVTGILENGQDGFLPFSDFAACSLLDLQPDERVLCSLYAELKCCAAMFLKADRKGVMQQLQARAVGEVLRRHAILASVAGTLCPSRPPPTTTCIMGMQPRSYIQSLSVNHEGSLHVLVKELEVLLYRYLTQHWELLQELVAVNEEDCTLCSQYLAAVGCEPLRSNSHGSTDSMSSLESLTAFNGFGLGGNGSSYKSGSREGEQQVSRARKNWGRAYRAALKKLASKRLEFVRRVRSMHEIFKSVKAPQVPRVEGRQPVMLFLGGGMAAGKSTVRELIGRSEFWSKVGKDAVVVEADAIKFHDVVYQKLSQRKEFSHDLSIDAYVHEYATKAANNLLVAAINDQRDVVFDGTHVWLPFVEQTIAMIRDYQHDYVTGPGYQEHADGRITEQYWVPVRSRERGSCDQLPPCGSDRHCVGKKVPYVIEMVGVTCDPGLAVVRGVWRRLRSGRSVPIASQLRSHRMFAENFERCAGVVDSATLYHTGGHLSTFNKSWEDMAPKVIAHRSSATQGEMLVNPPAYSEFKRCLEINDNAQSVEEIFPTTSSRSSRCPLKLNPELIHNSVQELKCLFQNEYKHEVQEQAEHSLGAADDYPSGLSSDSPPLSNAPSLADVASDVQDYKQPEQQHHHHHQQAADQKKQLQLAPLVLPVTPRQSSFTSPSQSKSSVAADWLKGLSLSQQQKALLSPTKLAVATQLLPLERALSGGLMPLPLSRLLSMKVEPQAGSYLSRKLSSPKTPELRANEPEQASSPLQS